MKFPKLFGKNKFRFNLRSSGTASAALFVVTGIIFFLAGFFSGFPEEILENRIRHELERNFPVRVTLDRVEIGFPASLDASAVKITPRNQPGSTYVFDSVSVAPWYSTLIGRPGIDFVADRGQGEVSGSIGSEGHVLLDVDSLKFSEPIQGFSSLNLSGIIRSARLDTFLDPEPDKPSSASLQIERLAVNGTGSVGLPIDRVDLGRLVLELEGTGRNMSVRRATLSGGAIEATANGRILVGKTVASTRLNFSVDLRPTSRLDPSLHSMFELVGSPGSNGSRTLSIRGSLARPVIR